MVNCMVCGIELVPSDSIVIHGKYKFHVYCHKVYQRKFKGEKDD